MSSFDSSGTSSSSSGGGGGGDHDNDDHVLLHQQNSSLSTLGSECPKLISSEEISSTDAPARRRPKKCVHFSDADPEIISFVKPSSSMTPEERSLTHWQLQDYEYFRGTARIIASEILKLSAAKGPTAHSYDTVLTRVHQYCSQDCCPHDWKDQQPQHVDCCVRENLSWQHQHEQHPRRTCTKQEGEEEEQQQQQQQQQQQEINDSSSLHTVDAVHVPPNLFAALTHWIRAGHSRRGLEKFCIPHHMQTRPLERQAGVDAVLIAQDLLQKTRNEKSASPKNNEDGMFRLGKWSFSLALPDDEILRILSERFSATSRKYAMAMGHADAAAVGNYVHTME
jgi:hypothetical protein